MMLLNEKSWWQRARTTRTKLYSTMCLRCAIVCACLLARCHRLSVHQQSLYVWHSLFSWQMFVLGETVAVSLQFCCTRSKTRAFLAHPFPKGRWTNVTRWDHTIFCCCFSVSPHIVDINLSATMISPEMRCLGWCIFSIIQDINT